MQTQAVQTLEGTNQLYMDHYPADTYWETHSAIASTRKEIFSPMESVIHILYTWGQIFYYN